ncbi:MAG: universal stress protein [Ferruginibacter sp.]
MKKILVLINDYNVPATALNFAVKLALQTEATLFGIFAQSIKYSVDNYLFPSDMNLSDKDIIPAKDEDEHLKFLNIGMKLFAEACEAENVSFKTHSISTNHLETLIDYSAFADLIVCDADTRPIHYSMNTFLADTHCAVLLINKDYTNAGTLVFAYDDKLSSINAIRLFTYLFGFYRDLPVHFVSVLPTNVLGLEYDDLIREWLPLHYSNAKIEIIKGETKNELTNYINGLSNPLIVMGAFGRSSLSRFFKESLANFIITQTNAPIFIAHN